MYLVKICAAWLLLAAALSAPCFAQGVVVVRRTPFRPFVGVVPVRQNFVQPFGFRQSFVQPLYAQQFNAGYAVQQFAQPVYQQQFVQPYVQQFVQPQAVYSQPFVQQFNGGYGGQQLQGGCANCFR